MQKKNLSLCPYVFKKPHAKEKTCPYVLMSLYLLLLPYLQCDVDITAFAVDVVGI